MYICLFTRAKSGREMTDCILSLPLMTVTDKHLCNISSKKQLSECLKFEEIRGGGGEGRGRLIQ